MPISNMFDLGLKRAKLTQACTSRSTHSKNALKGLRQDLRTCWNLTRCSRDLQVFIMKKGHSTHSQSVSTRETHQKGVGFLISIWYAPQEPSTHLFHATGTSSRGCTQLSHISLKNSPHLLEIYWVPPPPQKKKARSNQHMHEGGRAP